MLLLVTAANSLHAQWIKSRLPSNATYVNSIVSSGSNIFAGTWGGAPGSNVYLSSDNGGSWTMVDSGSGPFWVDALAMSGSNIFAAIYGGGIMLSSNEGASWAAVDSGLIDSSASNVLSLTAGSSIIVAGVTGNSGGTHSGRIYMSGNNGTSWTEIDSSMNPDSIQLAPYALAVSGSNIIVAAGRMLLSTDNGTKWTQISGISNYGGVRSIAASGSKIVAGTDNGCVLLSADNGANWTAIDSGLVAGIYALVWSGSNIFAGTESGGDGGRVYRITEDGSIWDTLDTGLRTSYVGSLGINSGYLFAGTYGTGVDGDTGAGVWRRPLSEITSVKKAPANELPKTFTLEQNYPDPFNPSTTISFTIPGRSVVTLKVYDILGREVSTIVSEELSAGAYSRQWNAAKMSSGIYFYRLQTGTFTQTKKMIVLK